MFTFQVLKVTLPSESSDGISVPLVESHHDLDRHQDGLAALPLEGNEIACYRSAKQDGAYLNPNQSMTCIINYEMYLL